MLNSAKLLWLELDMWPLLVIFGNTCWETTDEVRSNVVLILFTTQPTMPCAWNILSLNQELVINIILKLVTRQSSVVTSLGRFLFPKQVKIRSSGRELPLHVHP